jgi:AraC-like DNA-binding protein
MSATRCCPGELLFDTRYAVFRGRLGDTDTHLHAAVQWMAARAGEQIGVRTAAQTGIRGRAIEIAPGTLHALDEPAQELVVVWSEASRLGTAGRAAPHAGVRVVALRPDLAVLVDALFAASPGPGFRLAASRLAEALSAGRAHDAADPAVAAVVEWIEHDPDGIPDAHRVAQRVGLSASALARRFRTRIGMPPRAYRLWARLKRGLAHAASGASLTEAAHAAGFADAAHFTRTFRRHFGLAPSRVAPLLSRARGTAR